MAIVSVQTENNYKSVHFKGLNVFDLLWPTVCNGFLPSTPTLMNPCIRLSVGACYLYNLQLKNSFQDWALGWRSFKHQSASN